MAALGSSGATSSPMVILAPKTKTKKKHFVQQKVKVFRASDPVLSVFMWGVNHSVRSYRVLTLASGRGGGVTVKSVTCQIVCPPHRVISRKNKQSVQVESYTCWCYTEISYHFIESVGGENNAA